MKFSTQHSVSTEPLGEISRRYLAEESGLVTELAGMADVGPSARAKIQETAADLVRAVRKRAANEGGLDAFMQQYDLSSQEGVLLMCIAEALLRIPDAATADRLIADKLTSASWKEHLGVSDSLFVNASTWGLMLTGEMLRLDSAAIRNPAQFLGKLASRAGEPVVRTAMRQAMRIIGHQFVMGRTIGEALTRSSKKGNDRFRYSFDMLGEAALTAADAERYFDAYADAITQIGKSAAASESIAAPSISIKLSALHPRYDNMNHARVMRELVPRLGRLCHRARDAGIGLTVDAEEAHRLEMSLNVFEAVTRGPELHDYHGLGLAIQAYQRRAIDAVRFIVELADSVGRTIPVRLVKGAYWDTEVKVAQELGLPSYPVFTRKAHTDVSYLACARLLLSSENRIFPQFATHNAHTLASILQFAGSNRNFEFQRLHGMGEELYDEVVDPERYNRACRVYAPVGSHEDLLPYLVRRLLENGANTSFVNRILDEGIDVHDIVADPINVSRETAGSPHPRIPEPQALFGAERANSRGFNLDDRGVLKELLSEMDRAVTANVAGFPIVSGKPQSGDEVVSANPADTADAVGTCRVTARDLVDEAIAVAVRAQPDWDVMPAADRAAILETAADLFEENSAELLALCVREAGKTLPDALAELREAADFLRYYAAESRQHFGPARELKGPTGERNELGLRGRGVFVCISPWNFPLAIFTGQVAAALAAGNTVIAKPAEQTPLVAFRATQLLHEAGVPGEVLHFLPGGGVEVGGSAVAHPDVAGVAFTGSTETAIAINQALANRDAALAALVAETGGINAMFVDSSALPEQVVLDVVASAFNSAGQRCSALRLLCIQDDIAPRVIELLRGHMQELLIGDPADRSTDVGPVIDQEALDLLNAHIDHLESAATLIHRCGLPQASAAGTFCPPVAYEIDDVGMLEREVFGPVLHVIRYPAKEIGSLMDEINGKGYGLTMGLHSRIDSRAEAFVKHSRSGNIYINRNMIGAVVGVQPFGGRGLSGTGPKAGGPHYLQRFGTEYTVSNNIAAVGGNASLLSIDD